MRGDPGKERICSRTKHLLGGDDPLLWVREETGLLHRNEGGKPLYIRPELHRKPDSGEGERGGHPTEKRAIKTPILSRTAGKKGKLRGDRRR